MRPHYSQSSYENATPSSGTFPLASYKEVQPPPPGSLPGRDHSRFFFHSSPNIRFLLSLVSSVRVRSLLSWLYCPTEVFVDNSVAPSPQKSRFSNFDSNSIVFTNTKGICYQLLSIFSLLCFIFSLNWIKQLLKETENGTPHYICIGNSMICT